MSDKIQQVLAPEGEKRRIPRMAFSKEQFRLSHEGKVFSVVDLSEQGIGLKLIEDEDLHLFPMGGQISGTLNLEGTRIEMKFRVVHLSKTQIGGEFLDVSREFQIQIGDALDPRRLGGELKPMPAQKDITHWFHGPFSTDVLLWRGMDGLYERFLILVRGRYVQWTEETGTTSGRIESGHGDTSEANWGVFHWDLVEFFKDNAVDRQKLHIAKELILGSKIESDLKSWLSRHL
jgi:hypothetical protein